MNLQTDSRRVAILLGLYFSRFNEKGIKALGFSGSVEAFNTLGYSLGIKPASIKNYRDEFDPYFDNPRKGWHGRSLREYCKIVMDEFCDVGFEDFTEIIKTSLWSGYPIEKFVRSILPDKQTETIAKRLITGKAAEEYFRENYQMIPQFERFTLQDTTLLACGFDFKLELNADYYCVEVKGVQGKYGSVSLTEKEYAVAEKLRETFVLYIVTNFAEKPKPKLIFDPLHSELKFAKSERIITQISFSANI